MRYILDKAKEILDNYGGKNIFETAENSGAIVWERPLGGLKGFYLFENGFRYIVINEGLDKITKEVVCAHELGHDVLHRELSEGGIREKTLFLSSNKTEREANLFAAEVLISDEDILDEIADHNSINALCAAIGLPKGIVDFKIEILNYKGYHFNSGGSASDFLK